MEETIVNQEEQKSETKEVKVKKSVPVKKILRAVMGLLVLAGLGVGTYYEYRYRQNISDDINSIKSISSQVASLEEDRTLKTNQINSLVQVTSQPQYTNTNASGTPSIDYSNITFEKVLEDKNTALEDGYRLLIMDLKLENKTSNIIYFNTGELKVKDIDNYEYSAVFSDNLSTREYIKKDAKISLPDNRLLSGWATLNPGETVRLSVGYVLNRPGKEYKVFRADNLLKTINL